ncbi:hypothetical protein ACH4VR_16590 [Streptomyces sp. NPDC020883]|uniref:LppU/SCO3897 family protein n=1 Tax=Streptomyces sp. NPDC020883 TaxID=3365099 RepID=UPI0037954AF1
MTTPQGHSPYGQNPYAQQPYGQAPYPQAPPPQVPYGASPFGQQQGRPAPQAGYAYPQQPQPPYGQQPHPGFPQAPQQPYPQGGPPVPPQPTRPRRSPKAVLRGAGVVIGLMVIAAAWISSLDDADSAEAGDCVKKSSSALDDGLAVVDCGTAEAQYKVTAVHNGSSDPSVCSAGQDAYVKTVHRRRRADTAMVLCLTPTK